MKFHGDALRSGKKDELSVMEVHDLVPELDAVGFQPCQLGGGGRRPYRL